MSGHSWQSGVALLWAMALASCANTVRGDRWALEQAPRPEAPAGGTTDETPLDWTRGVRLEDALRVARWKNRSLAAVRAGIGLSAARLQTAGQSPFNPELELEGSSDALFGGKGESSVVLRLVQEFETGGQRALRQAVAQAGIRGEEAAVRDAERLLDADVIATFNAGLQLQRRVELAGEALDVAKEFLALAEKRLAAQDIAEVQVLPLRLDVARGEGEVMRRGRQLVAGKLLLVSLMGEEPRSEFELVGQLPEAPAVDLAESRLRRRMIEERPDLERLRHRVEEAELATSLARAGRSPNVTVGLGFERVGSQLDVAGESIPDRDDLIGFTISIPLPILNRREGEIAEAQSEVTLRRADLNAREREAISSLASAMERLRAATERTRFIEEHVLPLAEASLEAVRRGFETGEVATTEVLQAQDRLRVLREDFEEARFEVASARVALEGELGGALERNVGKDGEE